MDKKAAAAESKMRYQYSVRVLKTCVDAPDKVKEATEILQELAEGGYVEAQCSLGDYYSQGFHIEPDQAKAAYWYEESTKRGSLKAAETLAGLYCCHAPDGMSPEQASELALKWHKKWFSMLEAEAEKGGIKEAEALMDDNAIIELFFARSEQAIRELDDQYGRTCHKLSYNILNSCQDAEECVNDAYLGTWNAIPPTRPSPLLAFVCKIVRNLSLMRYHADRAAKRGGGSYTAALEELEDCLASPRTVEGDLEEKSWFMSLRTSWKRCLRRIGSFLCAATGSPTAARKSQRGQAYPRKTCPSG